VDPTTPSSTQADAGTAPAPRPDDGLRRVALAAFAYHRLVAPLRRAATPPAATAPSAWRLAGRIEQATWRSTRE
jgi:hypothetical protein